MRRYIRHPSDIPIRFSVDESTHHDIDAPHLKDLSLGGLCFMADEPLRCGAPIHIEFPIHEEFAADGVVAWCRPEGDDYAVGVEFIDEPTQFSVRMVEQICHIEHYRAETLSRGRSLSSEQAAKEWVEKYAANFPQ